MNSVNKQLAFLSQVVRKFCPLRDKIGEARGKHAKAVLCFSFASQSPVNTGGL